MVVPIVALDATSEPAIAPATAVASQPPIAPSGTTDAPAVVPAPPVDAALGSVAQPPPSPPQSDDGDDAASTVAASDVCSSEMGSASLIANGCTYTILEHMLMTPDKENVAIMMQRCAVALERIAAHLTKPV